LCATVTNKKRRIFPAFFVSKPKRSEVWHIIKGGKPLYIIKGLSLVYHHGAAVHKKGTASV